MVQTRTWKASLVVSPGAGDSFLGGRSKTGERFSSSRQVEKGASLLRDPAGAGSGPGKKTTELLERLADSILQKVQLHAG